MKKHITLLLLAVFTYMTNYGQQNNSTTIKAKWENSYNSILNIENYNTTSRYFTGTYGSHTGTSGQYRVIGFVGVSESDGSTPITLTIHWKPITGSKGTPDEKMTSIMTGQIYLDTQTGQYKMELFHNLNVPVPITTIVSDFNTPGNYTETLIFTVKEPASPDPIWNPSPIIASDYTGVWYDDNNSSPLLRDKINITAISADNVVQANYQSINDEVYLLKGFIGDSNSHTAKSVSLVGMNSKNNTVLSFSGVIDKVQSNDKNYKDVYLDITFDRYAGETSWEVLNENGIVVASKSYTSAQNSSIIVEAISLPEGNYTFKMKDSYGDGIFCSDGSGSYSLRNGLKTLISGGSFDFSDKNSFTVENLFNNEFNNNFDFYYDGIYVEGKPTGYSARYSAVKIEGFLMIGPDNEGDIITSVELQQQRIPLTNNGATEWISTTQIGSQQGENLKFGIDTGGNFNWANSVQCTTASCTGFDHHQFNQNESTTFEWINQTVEKVSWGPWGDGYANLGKDAIHFISGQKTKNDFRLITSFPNNPQFNEFLWDGGIALPSNTSLMLGDMSNFVARLISAGKIVLQETFPVSFYTNTTSQTGKIRIGAVDPSIYDESSKVVLSFTAYPGVEYLWTTSLQSFDLGGQTFGILPYFGIDSGSSALKGDSNAMSAAYNYAVKIHASTGEYPNMNFQMGTLASTKQTARLVLTSDQYVPLIDEGEHAGEYIPQIQTLEGVKGLLVQGSTLMNFIYTVFVYGIRINPTILDVELYAKEMWIYNLKNGPKIIQTGSQLITEDILNRHKNLNKIKAYPNPLKRDLTINLDGKSEEKIYIKVIDLTGQIIYRTSKNIKIGTNIFNLKNIIEDSKRIANRIVILTVENSSGTINFKEKIVMEQ